MTIEMKATGQFFHVVLFMMLYQVVLILSFLDEILVEGTEQFFVKK